jgi:hypothetical protein
MCSGELTFGERHLVHHGLKSRLLGSRARTAAAGTSPWTSGASCLSLALSLALSLPLSLSPSLPLSLSLSPSAFPIVAPPGGTMAPPGVTMPSGRRAPGTWQGDDWARGQAAHSSQPLKTVLYDWGLGTSYFGYSESGLLSGEVSNVNDVGSLLVQSD